MVRNIKQYERNNFKSSSSKLRNYDDYASVHIVCRFSLYLWSSINDISIRVNTHKNKTMTQNKKQVIDAIAYFEEMGFIQDLTTDKRHYAQILVDYAKQNMDMHRDEVYDAKQILKKAGYQIAIFNVSDITDHFYCSEDMAHQILKEVYNDMDEDSWNEIVYKCNHYEIKQKD